MSSFNYSNDQSNPAGAIPVWITAAPVADINGNFSNTKNNPSTGAIPVVFVSPGPPPAPMYPNDQAQMGAAIPVRVVSAPGPGPVWPSDQGQDASAIPVWIVGSTTDPELPAYPNNQALLQGAIPVWNIHTGSPGNTVAPVVTGTGTVGQTLTCSTGTWTATPTSYGYQWLRDGNPIGGQVISTYLVAAADHLHSISCIVTANNSMGSGAMASNAIAIS